MCNGRLYPENEYFNVDDIYEVISDVLDGVPEDTEYKEVRIDAMPTAEVAEAVCCENCEYLMTETHLEEMPYGFENEYKCYGCKRLFDLTNGWVDVMLDDFCNYGKKMNRERGGKNVNTCDN